MIYHSLVHRFAISTYLCLAAATGAFAASVTLDIAQKTISSDSDTLVARIAKTGDGQANVLIQSQTLQPQEFVLKVKGLKPGDQDVYVNGAYSGKLPGDELAKGAKFTIPGRITNPDLVRCVESLKDRVDQEVEFIESRQDSESVRVLNTLRQVQGWITTTVQADKFARSINLIIAPADAPVTTKATIAIKTPEESAGIYANACKTIQIARDRMYDNITFGPLRNQTLVAMTPVDLKLSYYMVGGKPKGTVVLINNCDLPVSGTITPLAPSGWKVKATNAAFSNVKSGQTYKVDFALIPDKAGSAAPKTAKADAEVKITSQPYTASFVLSAEAAQGATVTVPVVKKSEPAAPAPATSPAAPSVTAPQGG